MGVSVRLSRNARVYLPFWVAIPLYLFAGIVWLGVAVVWVVVWLIVQGCTLAGRGITATRRTPARGPDRAAREAQHPEAIAALLRPDGTDEERAVVAAHWRQRAAEACAERASRELGQ